MMAKALDANGAAKVYIVGRRIEKLQQVAQQAVGVPSFDKQTHGSENPDAF